MGDGAVRTADGGRMGGQAATAAEPHGDVMVLRLGYDGTRYAGYALQERQTHVRTVAGELKRALETLLRREVALTCAGRTDAGVHARAQHVSLPMMPEESRSLSGDALLRSLGALLPEDIGVSRVLRARDGFSARFDACARRYRYRIVCGPVPALFNGRWTWWIRSRDVGALDVAAMDAASRCLLGEHDFKSFCKASSAENKPTCRFVESIRFEREVALGESLLAMDIVGNAFLHSMVRTIMGSLVEVGLGRREPSWIAGVLAGCDRRLAGPCAPASGLTFWDVRYGEGALTPW